MNTKIKKCPCGSNKFLVRVTGTFKGQINLGGRMLLDRPEWEPVFTFYCEKCNKEYSSDQVWGIEVYVTDDLTKHAEHRQESRHIPSMIVEYALNNCFIKEVGKDGERKEIFHVLEADIARAHPGIKKDLGNYKNLRVVRDKQTRKIITMYIDTMYRKEA